MGTTCDFGVNIFPMGPKRVKAARFLFVFPASKVSQSIDRSFHREISRGEREGALACVKCGERNKQSGPLAARPRRSQGQCELTFSMIQNHFFSWCNCR